MLVFLLFFQVTQAQHNFNEVENWLSNNLSQLGGRAVLMVEKNGKIIYEKSDNGLSSKQRMIIKFVAKRQGKEANEALQDFTPTTRIAIASCSKWLSAALVMTFVDEGKLNLDDTIGKFLPVFSKNHKGNITIWECLSHLTAINGGNLKESRTLITSSNNMNDVMKKIAVKPMEGKPGKVFHYSSIGLQIAAAVIEKISGKDFNTLFTERIAQPCGMVNTDFGHATVPLAAGGAYSTPDDYMHFLQMILQGGIYNGKQILSKGAIIKMQHNYAKGATIAYSPEETGDWGYGFGEWTMDNLPPGKGAVSSPGLFGSFPWIDNDLQYAGFLFVFNIKTKGRKELYLQLKSLIDSAIANR